MTQLLQVTQSLPTETLLYETPVTWDAQNLPTYAAPVSFAANVVEGDVVGQRGRGAQFINQRDGTQLHIPLTLYVRGDAPNVPDKEARITRGGETFIVVERLTVAGLWHTAAEPDHYRLRCRKE
jgi:hypothetical protein